MLLDTYLWTKVVHVVAFTAWMAGLFYLPRLYVYHTQQAPGSDTARTFQVMERKLLRIIMNPAMIVTLATGGILIWQIDGLLFGWMHAKLLLVGVLLAFHMLLARWRREFAAEANRHSERFYRVVNEVPTVLLILIVILAILKPF
ncbi:MAG: protoporphyrinogen oxidase HemJ [Rhodospirillales bacterium]|nr:MAG: protoporphyrinogen oxidase HemJ [Rhodospirillales bacterium]